MRYFLLFVIFICNLSRADDQDKLNARLFRAASHGTVQEVKEALLAGADARAINTFTVKGAGIKIREYEEKTVLHKASFWNSDPEVIKALIDARADVHARDNFDNTPLHDAAFANPNPEVLKALIDSRADVHAKNKKDEIPIEVSLRYNPNPEVSYILLKSDPKPEKWIRLFNEVFPGFLCEKSFSAA